MSQWRDDILSRQNVQCQIVMSRIRQTVPIDYNQAKCISYSMPLHSTSKKLHWTSKLLALAGFGKLLNHCGSLSCSSSIHPNIFKQWHWDKVTKWMERLASDAESMGLSLHLSSPCAKTLFMHFWPMKGGPYQHCTVLLYRNSSRECSVCNVLPHKCICRQYLHLSKDKYAILNTLLHTYNILALAFALTLKSIHSFQIFLYSASSSPLLFRGVSDYSIDK